MNFEKYSAASDNKHEKYDFLSEGPNGTIRKVVVYRKIDHNIFNLAFGDWDENEHRINDQVRSNNNDRNRVLATVASTVIDFMKHHPGAILFVKGSTPGRTRLYQMGISGNWSEISQLFDVEGFYKNTWKSFEKGKNYHAFTLRMRLNY